MVGALFLFCLFVWTAVYASFDGARDTRTLTVAVLDVGQGDSIYIESPTGIQVLIDGGPDGAVLRALPEVMPAADRSLDAVVATHPDADHIAGLIDVLERYDVAAILESGVRKNTTTAAAFEKRAKEEGAPRVLGTRGMVLDLGGGAVLKILYPDRDVSGLPASKANEGGIVAELIYGESEMLFMADVSSAVESRLMQLGSTELDSDILKVGHHGSRFSTSDAFVKEVSPDVAIISVGKNSYGHPTEEVLDRFSARAAEILRTDKSGTVVCVSRGAEFACE